jgi:hypothetical protein
MIEFVQELTTQKHEDWPPGLFDPETGEIRLQCAVLRDRRLRGRNSSNARLYIVR